MNHTTDWSDGSERNAGSAGSAGSFSLANVERPLIFTHAHYRWYRAADRLPDCDLLMRRPDAALPPEAAGWDEEKRWEPVASSKYLKHRALEWREAADAASVPERWRAQAEALDAELGLGLSDDLGDDLGGGLSGGAAEPLTHPDETNGDTV